MLASTKTRNPQTNKRWSKLFKGALTIKSKVNHLKRLEVTGQGEILASQDFNCGCRLTYSVCVCDTLLSISQTTIKSHESVCGKAILDLPVATPGNTIMCQSQWP